MQKNWTREETILAFELYCIIPSKDVTVNNTLLIALANKINRTANSVKLKLQNFKSYDPSYTANGRVGLSHGSKLDEEIAKEFLDNWDSLAIEADKIKADFGIENANIEIPENIIGTEKIVQTKTRIGQNFFRKSILASYNSKCCITGLDIPELLRASHIKPWADSEPDEKVNPQNGLLLNSLHDLAFDKGLITINFDYEIVISEKIKQSENPAVIEYLQKFSGAKINLPSRFLPKKEFIEYHNDIIFGEL